MPVFEEKNLEIILIVIGAFLILTVVIVAMLAAFGMIKLPDADFFGFLGKIIDFVGTRVPII